MMQNKQGVSGRLGGASRVNKTNGIVGDNPSVSPPAAEAEDLKKINLKITDEEIRMHLKIIEALYPNMKPKVDKLINGTYNIFTKFLIQSHIDDYNSFVNVYLKNMPENIPVVEFSPKINTYATQNFNSKSTDSIKFYVSDIRIRNPVLKNDKGETRNDYPYLCKLSARTYEGEITLKINRKTNDEIISTTVSAGTIPVMVLSNLCNLSSLSKKMLPQKGEDESLLGGFFVISGHLKVIRYVIHPKYNTILLNDENKVHMNCLLNDNSVYVNFLSCPKFDFFTYGARYQNSLMVVPLHIILLLLSPIKKKSYLFNKMKMGIKNENAVKYIEQYIQSIFMKNGLNEKEVFEKYNLKYLGNSSYFRRGIFRYNVAPGERKGKIILRYAILPHIQSYSEKFETICMMFKTLIFSKFKLMAKINKDSLENHAVTTCSHLLSNLLKEQILTCLGRLVFRYSRNFYKFYEKKYDSFKVMVKQIYLRYKEMVMDELDEKHLNMVPLEGDDSDISKAADSGNQLAMSNKSEAVKKLKSIFMDEKEKLFSSVESYIQELYNDNNLFVDISKSFITLTMPIIFFFKTGNISSENIGYQQRSGWVIGADEINSLRFITNFRAIHRGCFFQEVKVLSPRKLLGEAWGFICPVHTPDGSPCGLLNHLSQFSYVHNSASNESHKLNIKLYLKKIGVNVNLDDTSGIPTIYEDQTIPILVDSVPITYISEQDFNRVVYKLKYAKNHNLYNLKAYFEINAYLNEPLLMDSIIINTFPGRLIRPLFNLKMKCIEYISPAYQPYVAIAINYEHIKKNNLARKMLRMKERLVRSKKGTQQKMTIKEQYLFHARRMKLASSSKGNALQNSSPVKEDSGASESKISRKVLQLLEDSENKEREHTDSQGDITDGEDDYISSSNYDSSGDSCGEGSDDQSNRQSDDRSDKREGKYRHSVPPTSYTDSDENVNLDIYEQMPEKFEYMELKETSFLSFLGSLTPFSDHNQSPRNIYQCQMLKQTMGIQSLNMMYTFTNKIYRMITPQYPLVVTRDYELYGVDNFPSGTNAVVAILAYTGYDMEDALIINKSSAERGIFRTHIYKTIIIDLKKNHGAGDFALGNNVRYTNKNAGTNATSANSTSTAKNNLKFQYEHMGKFLNKDGLPRVQQKMVELNPLYSYVNKASELTVYEKFKEHGEYYVDCVTNYKSTKNQIGIIRLRTTRPPLVGDKFASRHGQKGVVSRLFPHEDMPFSESGIVPDVIFNPHGIPSRMTIGMLIESICGKAACMYGKRIDATPFRKYTKQKSFNNEWIDNCGVKGFLEQVKQGKNEDGKDSSSHAPGEEVGHSHKGKKKNDIPKGETPKGEKNNITYDEKIDYFAKLLLNKGYDYYGTELLYSGIYGVPLQAHIFFGVIYYQRLRHMAYDKAQVRRTGPICNLTHQPLKGKKKHGGIRLGEMERDGLISHGCSFIINERFLINSDGHECFVCPQCGLILSPIMQFTCSGEMVKGRSIGGRSKVAVCKSCGVSCKIVYVPYVLRYLLNELICLNITIRLNIKSVENMFDMK
ncbi:DNA-directed RNA polymerase I subunit RPA2, putative [Plasmodium knowlesi strain H]|uniref:DNA-directed RNA polymerase subunit beta n=3 Tax=Plasmodium knowlesi TaxID=5850 RepID=A0A5K1TZV6_PLAKH|nr:DNA-directed RNA polymerase I subunit RPA2, putative [Plasmodium knowlesi strain H]OTN64855.1 DNA-directed RNA polymerase subunit beta [Plasmodium knowlesi]CAA9988373.1 DNA-directed RNA polymerase I subunit RPA2, putative [Plasmodium knowlesi strain H]SBO20015.1 DNA-directed RNA polymerase I subunit RPA2, putative [Plasmodium knowlesi strain H]SBO20335.1 DNA-directed RNA polymerase I subunit RPA2, putative [Plasmodium knowlesi strain H]VVS77847.1 DNA-directed RNA polymerase I subunit RPA2, |eukprot:XP_002259354.1 dna-directed rna polymerase, beta subunit,putative [Plasmodium knowlesi strain H]